MTKKTDQQLQDYARDAVRGEDGVTLGKSPTDPQNEQAYEQAKGMTASEAKEFEKAVKEDADAGLPVIGDTVIEEITGGDGEAC